MSPFPKGGTVITGSPSRFDWVHADRVTGQGSDPGHPQTGGSSEVITLSRVERSLVLPAQKAPRILLVDAALALRELHLFLLRSIPAIVEKLTSCADMYIHRGHGYALVILVLHPQSRETAEAADFVRHRWGTARILVLGSESAAIDDWLYDERIEPHLNPACVRDAAIRLISGEKYWIPA